MSTVVSTVVGLGGGLRGSLNTAMIAEKSRPAILNFTVFDEAGQITTYDWLEETFKADHTALGDAIQHCLDNLASNRTQYHSIHVNVGDTSLDNRLDFPTGESWMELVFCGELITLVTAQDGYMIQGDNVNHVRVIGANLDHDFSNQSSGGGIKFLRSSNIYMRDCFVVNAFSESYELKECTNGYFEQCLGDNCGDDNFSILDSSYVLIKQCKSDNARDVSGDSGCFEFEDGSHHCVMEDSFTDNSAENGIHIILDPASTKTLSAIADQGGGIYRATTTGVTSWGTKDVKIYTATPTGVHDGVWPITAVDTSAGLWFDFDTGTAGLSGTDSDRADFHHGVCHDIYIYNHQVDNTAGNALNIVCNADDYTSYVTDKTDPLALRLFNYNIYVDGLQVRNVQDMAVSVNFGKDMEFRNIDAIGESANDITAVNVSKSRGMKFYDCKVSHYGEHGYKMFSSTHCEFYRCVANDVSENTGSTNGAGFFLDPDQWDVDLQENGSVSNTIDAGFVVQDCRSLKVNWNNAGAADWRTGIRLQDHSGTTVDSCVTMAFSASEVLDFVGGATAGNNTGTNIIAFEQ